MGISSCNDSDVAVLQLIDQLTIRETERLTATGKNPERHGRKVNEGNEWAGPRRRSDSETAICCHGPEGLWFLILLATVVMNTGSNSQRHNQSQSTSFGSVTPLHGPPAVTHSFILTVCVWLHLCPHTLYKVSFLLSLALFDFFFTSLSNNNHQIVLFTNMSNKVFITKENHNLWSKIHVSISGLQTGWSLP